MLSMTRWNPFEELTGLHREMDRVFGRYVGDERAGAPATAWIPATEVDSGEPARQHLHLSGGRAGPAAGRCAL